MNNLSRYLAAVLCLSISIVTVADLIPIKNAKDKWGFVNENGKEIVSCKYDKVETIGQDLYKVCKGHKWGMVDDRGKEILSVKYDLIEKTAPDIFLIAADGKYKDGVLMDEKYGFANGKGKILLKPEYDEIGPFINGLAYVCKDEKYGYIDDIIEFVIPCKYSAVGTVNNQGFVWVNEGGKPQKNSPSKISGGKYGVYNSRGEVIIPVKYKQIGWCSPITVEPKKESLDKMDWAMKNTTKESGLGHFIGFNKIEPMRFGNLGDDILGFYVCNSDVISKNGIVDLTGKELVSPGKYERVWFPTDGISLVMTKKAGFCIYNYLDLSKKKLILDENIYDGQAFNDGYAVVVRPDTPVKKGAKAVTRYEHSVIDTKGRKVSNDYNMIFALKDGVHVVLGDGGYGLIDNDGTELIKTENNVLLPPSENLLLRREKSGDKFGYVDKSGNWIIDPIYNSAASFKYGWASVKDDNGWGYIASDGSVVVPLKWNNLILISEENPEVIFVYEDANEGAQPYNVKTGQLLGEKKYGYVRNFDTDFSNVALVGTDNSHIGIIDKNGDDILPFEFTYPVAMDAYKLYMNKGQKTWTSTDSYRIKLKNNEKRNKGRLNETLSNDMWDY